MAAATKPFYRAELSLIVGLVTAGLFLAFGQGWLEDLTNTPKTIGLFAWLFGVMLWSSFGVVTGKTVVLGLSAVDMIMLVLTLAVSAVNFGANRTNVVQGLVHLILFATYCLMLFDA